MARTCFVGESEENAFVGDATDAADGGGARVVSIVLRTQVL